MQLKKAQAIAHEIKQLLLPYCVPGRFHVAGSVRRGKAEVKDIEIVCQPLIHQYHDMFGEAHSYVRNKDFVYYANNLGTCIKGNAKHGRYQQILLPEGINLDLFMPDATDYFRQLTIRTGSAEYVVVEIAKVWKRKGWCGSDRGFRKVSDCIEHITQDGKIKWICVNDAPELPPVWQSEEEFFDWLGVRWVDPVLRNV